MTSAIFLEFDARNHTVVVLLGLGATLLATCKGATFEVVTEQGAKIVLPNCACHLAQMGPDLYRKSGGARITTLGQLPASIV